MFTFSSISAEHYEVVVDSLLIPNFSESERGSRAELLADFQAGQYIGTAAWDAKKETLLAVSVGWRVTEKSILLSWLAVDQSARSQGIGGKLLDTSLRDWENFYHPELILGEIESPTMHAVHAAYGDPAARWRFYQRHGARRIDLPYAMPTLAPELPPVEDMWLLLFGGKAYELVADPKRKSSFASQFGGELENFLYSYLESSAERREAGKYRPAVEKMLMAVSEAQIV